jgi:hypothetical protein
VVVGEEGKEAVDWLCGHSPRPVRWLHGILVCVDGDLIATCSGRDVPRHSVLCKKR